MTLCPSKTSSARGWSFRRSPSGGGANAGVAGGSWSPQCSCTYLHVVRDGNEPHGPRGLAHAGACGSADLCTGQVKWPLRGTTSPGGGGVGGPALGARGWGVFHRLFCSFVFCGVLLHVLGLSWPPHALPWHEAEGKVQEGEGWHS